MNMDTSQFHKVIFSWWREHGRVLPWREKSQRSVISDQLSEISIHTSVRERAFDSYFAGGMQRDPYRVIVSELMLQQTQVDRVLPKYEAWMEKWPTVQDLAKAELAEVITEWKGLGYNRRARFLWLLAQEIVNRKENPTSSQLSLGLREAGWPTTEEELIKLPGIGKYTARALMSFAFGQQVGVVDTNVKRVLGRWLGMSFPRKRESRKSQIDPGFSSFLLDLQSGIHARVRDDKVVREIDFFNLADSLLPEGLSDPWNQALMDFGALICTAKNPKCEVCPVQDLCKANLIAREEGFENYSQYIKLQETSNKKQTKRGKDRGLKFKETDRYIRGRIIDLLREKEWTMRGLLHELSRRFKLQDKLRNTKLIGKLMDEKLIVVVGEKVRFGDS